MKYLSLFSGIGAFEKALDYLNVKYELVNYCEIDKYASMSYSLIHSVPEGMNLGDITKVDTSKLPNDIDLITYGFPCQDISLAGKQKGFFQENIMEALKRLEFTDEEIKNLYIYISSEKPSDSQLFDKLYDEFLLYEDDINALLLMGINKLTRSGLFFEALRIIEATKPKVAIAENVKNLTSKKFKTEFGIVLKSLEEAGYNNYWQVLNSKNYGVPQNRERVFIVSIRKDIDNGAFKFPEPYELKLRLKDMLEDEVDEKYFLSEAMIKYISFTGTKNFKNPDCKINLDIARPLTTDQGKRAGTTNYISKDLPDNFDLKDTDKLIQVGNLTGGKWDKIHECCRRVYDPEGLAPTIPTACGGNHEPKILIKNATKKGYLEAEEGDGIDISGRMEYHRGNVQKGMCQTITTDGGNSRGVVVKTKIPLKRGYSVDVKEESPDTTDIDVLGNYSKSNYMATQIVGKNGIAPTVRENHGQVTATVIPPLRIRKLTPTECFRLMGFEDEVINTLRGKVSNTQLYKQAGNSIVVDVLEEIFVELFKVVNLNVR